MKSSPRFFVLTGRSLCVFLAVLLCVLLFLSACAPGEPAESGGTAADTTTAPATSSVYVPETLLRETGEPEPPGLELALPEEWLVRPEIPFITELPYFVGDLIEQVHTDSDYRYVFLQWLSEITILVFPDGERISLRDALETGKITIGQAVYSGMDFLIFPVGERAWTGTGKTFAPASARTRFIVAYEEKEARFYPPIGFMLYHRGSYRDLAQNKYLFDLELLKTFLDGAGIMSAADTGKTFRGKTERYQGREYVSEHMLRDAGLGLEIASGDGKTTVKFVKPARDE